MSEGRKSSTIIDGEEKTLEQLRHKRYEESRRTDELLKKKRSNEAERYSENREEILAKKNLQNAEKRKEKKEQQKQDEKHVEILNQFEHSSVREFSHSSGLRHSSESVRKEKKREKILEQQHHQQRKESIENSLQQSLSSPKSKELVHELQQQIRSESPDFYLRDEESHSGSEAHHWIERTMEEMELLPSYKRVQRLADLYLIKFMYLNSNFNLGLGLNSSHIYENKVMKPVVGETTRQQLVLAGPPVNI